MRQVVKINTAVFLSSLTKWNLILGLLLLGLQFILGLVYVGGLKASCPITMSQSECNEGAVRSINHHGLSNDTRGTFIGLEFCFITL